MESGANEMIIEQRDIVHFNHDDQKEYDIHIGENWEIEKSNLIRHLDNVITETNRRNSFLPKQVKLLEELKKENKK